jgi:hypothetical protein
VLLWFENIIDFQKNWISQFSFIIFEKYNKMSSISSWLQWIVKSRFGLAQVAGLIMVPSQQICPRPASDSENYSQLKKFCIVKDDYKLNYYIYYPPNYRVNDNSRCIVYNNPNMVICDNYVYGGKLQYVPKLISELMKCPIIIYDYRGTGLNWHKYFYPTANSIIDDSFQIIKMALKNFQHVTVFGTSLGGGASTVALDQYLQIHPYKARSVQLINHDSFNMTSRVVGLPNLLAWMVGGQIDVKRSIKNIVEIGVRTIIIGRDDDPVLGHGACLHTSFQNDISGIRTHVSPVSGHGELSDDMVMFLRELKL